MKKIIVIAGVVLCVWLIAAFPHVMINPGDLVEGHQDLKEKCNACHEPFWGISSEKCISCHKLSEIGKDTLENKETILFHENLAKEECTSCHTDHKGIHPTVSLSKFDHSFLSSTEQAKCNSCHEKPSDNLHKQVSASCNSCHDTKGWKSAVAFNHNMIQGTDKNNCLACHQKPNDSFHGSFEENCSECHSTDKWVPSSFDHSSYFLLDENHNAQCSTCHSNNNFSAYTCYGCHEHSESKIREEHNEEGISNFDDCASCHKSGNEHDIRYNDKTKNSGNQNDVKDVKNYMKSLEKDNKKKGDGKKEGDDD